MVKQTEGLRYLPQRRSKNFQRGAPRTRNSRRTELVEKEVNYNLLKFNKINKLFNGIPRL
jgi:hypothetical protein